MSLYRAWDYFKRGKRKRQDLQQFERLLEDHLFQLQDDLLSLHYKHGPYGHFYVSDPKQRRISKASVRDRLLHQVVYAILNEIFDKSFYFYSLSSRKGKGTHLGVKTLQRMLRSVSLNGTAHCYVLKMDIRRFFDSISHEILKKLIRKKVDDKRVLLVVDTIIDSFEIKSGAGMPLGNVTSQLFANIYLHELDLFVKHSLQEKCYLRYCDDFVVVSSDAHYLRVLVRMIGEFLNTHLRLELHPKKVTITKFSQGVDFVGSVIFPKHLVLRTRTKRRMKKRLEEAYNLYLDGTISPTEMDQKVQSYLGILSHTNHYALSQSIKNAYWVRDL